MAEREYTYEEVLHRLHRAAERVRDNDIRLMDYAGSEQAVAHRLAVYVEHEFPEFSTDCEYNRQGDEGATKRAVLIPGGKERGVEPDIIVHKRGPDGPNLLAIEVKYVRCTDEEREHDINKLQSYLERPLSYAFAFFITYGCGDDAGTFWFEPIEPRREALNPMVREIKF
jgi:hypothetical protein